MNILKSEKGLELKDKKTGQLICGHHFPKVSLLVSCRKEIEIAMRTVRTPTYLWVYSLSYEKNDYHNYNFNFGIPKNHLSLMLNSPEMSNRWKIRHCIESSMTSTFRNTLFYAIKFWYLKPQNDTKIQSLIAKKHNLFRTDYPQEARSIFIDEKLSTNMPDQWDSLKRLKHEIQNSDYNEILEPYYIEWEILLHQLRNEQEYEILSLAEGMNGLCGMFLDIHANAPLIWLSINLNCFDQKNTKFTHINDCLIYVNYSTADMLIFEPRLMKSELETSYNAQKVKKAVKTFYMLLSYMFQRVKNKQLSFKRVMIEDTCIESTGLQATKNLIMIKDHLCLLFSPYYAALYALNRERTSDVPCVLSLLQQNSLITMAMFMYWLYENLREDEDFLISSQAVVITNYEKTQDEELLLLR